MIPEQIDQLQAELQLAIDLADSESYTDGYTDARLLQAPQSRRLAYMDGYRAARAEMLSHYHCCCVSDLAVLDSEYSDCYEF